MLALIIRFESGPAAGVAAAPAVSTGQIVLAMMTAAVTVAAVYFAHRFSRERDNRAHRIARIESLFMAGREVIAECSLMCREFGNVARGQRRAADAANELAGKMGEAYKFGGGERPYIRVQMLIALYFPHVQPWLDELDATERNLRERMRLHGLREPIGTPFRDEGTVQLVDTSLKTYTTLALKLSDIM